MCIVCGTLYNRNHSTGADAVNPRTRSGSTLADADRQPIFLKQENFKHPVGPLNDLQ